MALVHIRVQNTFDYFLYREQQSGKIFLVRIYALLPAEVPAGDSDTPELPGGIDRSIGRDRSSSAQSLPPPPPQSPPGSKVAGSDRSIDPIPGSLLAAGLTSRLTAGAGRNPLEEVRLEVFGVQVKQHPSILLASLSVCLVSFSVLCCVYK